MKLALGMKPTPFLVQMVSDNSSSCSLITAFQFLVGTNEHNFTTEEHKDLKKEENLFREAGKMNERAQEYLLFAYHNQAISRVVYCAQHQHL